jgi:hypothetical protein
MDKVPRHSTEVDYHRFRDELLGEMATATRADTIRRNARA